MNANSTNLNTPPSPPVSFDPDHHFYTTRLDVPASPIDLGDLRPISVPFRFGSNNYVLREASEEAAAEFQNANLRATRFSDGKVVGSDGTAATRAQLVSRCLFLVGEDGQEKSVHPGTVRSWPHRIVRPLFEKVREISRLGEDDESTEAQLEKEISRLQLKLKALREGQDPVGKASTSTGGTSGSPTS